MPIARLFAVVLALMFCALPDVATAGGLDYRQKKDLTDGVDYLDEVDAYIADINKALAGMKPGDASVPIQQIQNVIAARDRALQRLGYAKARFAKLPADNADVAAASARVPALEKTLADVEPRIAEIKGGVMKVIEQGSGAGYKADFDRLREITVMYGNPQILQSQVERAAEVVKQMAATKAERVRIGEKYADLLKQDTPASNEMRGVLRNFDSVFGEFETAEKAYAAEAPAKLGAEIEELIRLGNEGVKENRPGYFGETGGVNSNLKFIEQRYTLMAAALPGTPELAAARKRIEDARVQVKQMKAQLNDAIVKNNQPPNESYNGADKAELIKLITAKWAEGGNAKKVLKVGINSDNWQRQTYWQWQTDAWYKVDKSRIQGHVLVQGNDKEAHGYYINLVKDHLANDSIKLHFFNEPNEEVDATYRVLLSKVQ